MPDVLPRFLPDDWKGGFVLLVMVFVLSSFLDNIAAAMIGGTMARAGVPRQGAHRLPRGDRRRLQRRRLGQRGRRHHHHDDVDRRRRARSSVLDAYVAAARRARRVRHPGRAAAAALLADHQGRAREHRASTGRAWSSSRVDPGRGDRRQRGRQLRCPELLDRVSVHRRAVWVAILVTAPLRQPDWELLPGAFKGTVFLLALVICASLMPVEKLPAASWQTALGLGFVSAVFDNIPLTALALEAGRLRLGLCSPTRSASAAR